MKLSELFTDDDAVSPVIGVILMVAITVILAAVIATFVLGLGQQVSQSAPRASFTFDYTEATSSGNYDTLNITHDGGDTIGADRLKVVSNQPFDGANEEEAGSGNGVTGSESAKFSDFYNQFGTDSDVTAGDQLDIHATNGGDVSNDFGAATIRIIWESQEGDSTATLAKFEGPDA